VDIDDLLVRSRPQVFVDLDDLVLLDAYVAHHARRHLGPGQQQAVPPGRGHRPWAMARATAAMATSTSCPPPSATASNAATAAARPDSGSATASPQKIGDPSSSWATRPPATAA